MATETKLEKLVDQAIALGIELKGDEKEEDIKNLISEKNNEDNDSKDSDDDKKSKSKAIFYWVKIKSFINDSETIEAGLYKTNEPNERLGRSRKEYVETFMGEIPAETLYKIAKLYRVATFENNGEKQRPAKDILEELVKEL